LLFWGSSIRRRAVFVNGTGRHYGLPLWITPFIMD
jgi:hypothetical protein